VFRNVAIVLLLVCLSLPAYAQQKSTTPNDTMSHHEMGMMRMWGMRGMLSDREIDRSLDTLQRTLNLNASQVSSIRQLTQKRRESFRTMREESRPQMEQLMTLLNQDNPDPAAVGRIVVDLKKTHEQFKGKQADFEKQFDSILDSTQRKTVNNLRSEAPTFMALRRLGAIGASDSRGMFISGFGRSSNRGSADDEY